MAEFLIVYLLFNVVLLSWAALGLTRVIRRLDALIVALAREEEKKA